MFNYTSRCRDKVLLLGVSFAVPYYPWVATVFLYAVIESADGRSHTTKTYIYRALRLLGIEDPAEFIRTRSAAVCGDGAYAGGEDKKHNPQRLSEVFHTVLWDLFHLLDKALTKALKASRMAQFFIRVLQRLEYKFAYGQGRFLDRAVSDWLDQAHRTPKTPVAHKMAAYLAGVPDRFLKKYQNFYWNLVFRCSHALQGRTGASYEELRELGTDLANESMVVFALGLAPGLERTISKVSGMSQDPKVLPWVKWRALQDCELAIAELQEDTAWWRKRVKVLALVAPYCVECVQGGPSPFAPSLWRLWFALCLSPIGRRAFTSSGVHLGLELYHLLFSGEFKGCDLVVACPKVQAHYCTVHPACQCGHLPRLQPGSDFQLLGGRGLPEVSRRCALTPGTRVQILQRGHESFGECGDLVQLDPQTGTWHVRMCCPGTRVPNRFCHSPEVGPVPDRHLVQVHCQYLLPLRTEVNTLCHGQRVGQVPWWVAKTVYTQAALTESWDKHKPETQVPRWQMYDTKARGQPNKGCVVSALMKQSFVNIDEGLQHLQALWQSFREFFTEYCTGSVGVTKDARNALSLMTVCFWCDPGESKKTEHGRTEHDIAYFFGHHRMMVYDGCILYDGYI